jgi:putative ABC transport system permease protein
MPRRATGLLVRWSLRDLRRRWLLVVVIALIIAVGTGTFAALGSTATWRRESNDASFSRLRMHDLRVTLAQNASVGAGTLAAIVRGLPHADRVSAVSERLTGETQVDASHAGRTILVPGEIVGVDVSGQAGVDELYASDGRRLLPADRGRRVALLEHQFATHYDLPADGSVRVRGGTKVPYVGVGTSPQHFIVSGPTGRLFAQGGLAVLFVPLAAAQALLDDPGHVNEIVLRLANPNDVALVERELTTAMTRELPDTGVTMTRRADEPAFRMLYEDIENDQQFWNIIALLILAGATFAAFNLTSRIVEAQRREIGIGMALGETPRRLALRPSLVGAEIAAIGVIAGLIVGLGLTLWLRNVFASVLPLPEWRTAFQAATFARAAALGFVMPLVATAIPVWRAVRVEPVDAIRRGNIGSRIPGLARVLARFPLPGRSFRRLPARNLMRAPRRTFLTALAIAAAITTLVATIGLVDSFLRTIDRGESEVTRQTPDRLSIALDSFYPVGTSQVRDVMRSDVVRDAHPMLRVFGTLDPAGAKIDVLIDLVDFERGLWTPTITKGSVDAIRKGGLVISRKAADDLHVDVGETITFRHPKREGFSYELVDSAIEIAAVHPNPLRALAFVDTGQAARFELTGLANYVEARPAPGVSEDDAIRALFTRPGVASVQGVATSARQIRDTLKQFFDILRVAELLVLALTLLIAFNSSSISMEERRREHATMLAFGLRPRTVLGMTVSESAVTGVIGTVIGIILGFQVVRYVMHVQLNDTMPDLRVIPSVSAATIVTAVLFGVVAVACAPLLAARRVQRMDIPATLRVME